MTELTISKSNKFIITGMDCADCARTLEKGVAALPGVVNAQVNFSAASMEVGEGNM